MAYTNPWSDVIPAGTAQASTIDDQIRRLRLDVRERMDTVLAVGKKWTDDPIAIDTTSLGAVTGRKIFIPGLACQHVNDENDTNWNRDNGYFLMNEALTGTISVCPVQLPVGVTVTRVRALIANNIGTLTVDFKSRPFDIIDSPVQVASGSSNITGMNKAFIDVGGLSHVVVDGTYWFVNTPTNGLGCIYAIYGYEITVNIPDIGKVV